MINMQYWFISSTALILLVVIMRAIILNRCSKRILIMLWWMVILRMLIPLIPISDYNIYSLFQKIISLEKNESNAMLSIEKTIISEERMDQNDEIRKEYDNNIIKNRNTVDYYFSKLKFLWGFGCIALLVSLVRIHLLYLKKYKLAIPVKDKKVLEWIRKHRLWRQYEIKVLENVETPFSYGIIKPVIILPSKICMDSWESLQYILFHEFTHVRNWDIITKWALVIAICIHWFNPAAWLMYFFANRDIELHCDECVIKNFGYHCKSIYAMILVKMEENIISRLPVSNCFAKNAIEERIRAIMKTKKNSMISSIATIVIVISISISMCFIITPSTDNARNEGKILERYKEYLIFHSKNSGYDKLTVSEYREKIYREKNSKELDELVNRIQIDTELKKYKYINSEASFLLNVMLPMVSDKWNEYSFKENIDNGTESIEYQFTMYLRKPDELLIKKYEDTIELVSQFLQQCLNDSEMIINMKKDEYDKIYDSIESYSDDNINISLDFVQFLSDSSKPDDLQTNPESDDGEDPEKVFSVPATTEDFRYVLSVFEVDNYEKMSVKDYRDFVACKMIEDESLEGKLANIFLCLQRNNMKNIDISVEEQNFIAYTLKTTFAENRNDNFPLSTYLRVHDYPKELGVYIDFKIYYTVVDENKCTVGERDAALIKIIDGVEDCIETMSKDDFENNNQTIVSKRANELAEKNSSTKIKCNIQQLQWNPD